MKATKRFKFRSFSERISAIKIDVVHRISRADDIDEDAESCFVEGLNKWRDLNSTASFTEFAVQAHRLVQTFPQVVHHQETLVNLLKDSLRSASHMALQPLLDLTVQLVRDLQADFYSHFQDFLTILCGLATVSDSQVVEEVFTCLAYLIKFLWRQLVKDIKEVYNSYCSLLANNKKLHVRRFAAESFAFLLRKCKKQEDMIDIILESLDCSISSQQDVSEGVCLLLFETMRGVNMQFHSSTETFLSMLLVRAANASHTVQCAEDKVLKCLKTTMERMAEYCREETSKVVWDVLIDCLNDLYANRNKKTNVQLQLLVPLLQVWISWRKGARIICAEKVCKVLQDILPCAAAFGDGVDLVISACLSLFLVRQNWSSEEAMHCLLQSIYELAVPVSTLSSFSLSLFHCAEFVAVALPLILKWLNKSVNEDPVNIKKALWILTAFYQFSRKEGKTLEFKISVIEHTEHLNEAVELIISKKVTQQREDVVLLWAAVHCACLLQVESNLMTKLIDRRQEMFGLVMNSNQEDSHVLLFVLCKLCEVTLRSHFHSLNWSEVIQLLQPHSGCVFALDIACQYVQTTGETSQDKLLECSRLLLDNMSNPCQQIRLLSVRLLSSLETNSDFYNLCLRIQETPASLAHYREKIVLMHQFSAIAHGLNDVYKEVALQFLIGSFYLNFQPMWQPISELISMHCSDAESKKLFWPVFSGQLRVATLRAVSDQSRKLVFCDTHSELETLLFKQLELKMTGNNDGRCDHANFRLLLWRCLADVVHVAEQHSRDVTPIFLDFLANEYFAVDASTSHSQNLTKDIGSNDDENNLACSKNRREGHLSRKEVVKTLSTMLALFGKFHNPKAMFREQEMRQVFTMLLTHKDSEIQQRALDALMCYRPSYLVPYKDNLNRLLKDETIRDELVLFSVDEENGVVALNHRKELMRILARILYGRMVSHFGGRARKQGGMAHRGIVLRYFSGCPADEFALFVEIAIQPFRHAVESKANIRDSSVDPADVVPLRKQQGFLSLVGQMFSSLRDQVQPHLATVFPVLLHIGHSCVQLLDTYRQTIGSCFIPTLRSLRQSCLNRMADVFKLFEQFDVTLFKEDLFAVAVWPQLSRLKDECIQHPTALLVLLHKWTDKSINFQLLSKPFPHDMERSILSYVFECLSSKGVSSSVVCLIFEIAANLSSSEDDNKLGPKLMEPHIAVILSFLSSCIQTAVENSKVIPKVQLRVLYNLSNLVSDSDQSETVILLLLKLFDVQNCYGKEEETHMLLTVKNLIANVKNTMMFVWPLSHLLCKLTKRESRQALCDVFQVLSTLCTDLSQISAMLQQMNAWDKSRLEEVDYDSRLLGFTAAREFLETKQLCCNLLLPLVAAGCHTLLHCDDMSLRDAASKFIQTVICQISLAEKDQRNDLVKIIIGQMITPAVRIGLKAMAEATRHEHLVILSTLTQELSDHVNFRDLTVLLSDNAEADFFKNFCHIQVHRRVRALRELTIHIRNGLLSSSTLTGFVVPLVTKELFASTDHNIVNEAVNVIGAAASQYKWSLYFPLMKHYIRLLTRKPDKQKTVSRIVTAVLDAFHFDLIGVGDVNDGVEEKAVDEVSDGVEAQLDNKVVTVTSHLSERQAWKIHDVLLKQVLPALNEYLMKTTRGGHKLGHSVKLDDQQDLLKVPVVLAVVKLLQKMPLETLKSQLPGVIMRICQMLKSRSREVRDVARNTLVKMVVSLGPSFLSFVISELKHLLNKGFQVHVMAYTCHSVVSGLSDSLHSGDFDGCLQDSVEISLNNLFGAPAEEREEGDLTSRLPEAKSSHSFEMFELAAKFTSPSKLSCIVEPLRKVALTNLSVKLVHCIEEALRRVGLGLQANNKVSAIVMLRFIQDVLSHGIDQMQKKRMNTDSNTTLDSGKILKPDLFSNQLCPKEPARAGKIQGAPEQATLHVLVAFGLQLLVSGVKKQAFDSSCAKQLQLLNEISPVVISCIGFQHNKVLSLALRVVSHIVVMKITSIETCIDTLMPRLFSLLRQYSRTGAAVSGANHELLQVCFKAITAIIRNYNQHTVSDKDLKVLLTYVEEDLYDPMRQGTAFPLLKAILSRTLCVSMLHDVMKKVEELSIQSAFSTVRLNCRQCILQYILDYPLGKRLQDHFDLFVQNLSYHTEDGRASVLELLVMFFNRLPLSVMHRNASYFFVPLMLRLFNDESTQCKKLVSGVIRMLLEKIEVQKRDKLFALVLTWMADSKVLHQRLASQACSLFVDVESALFERRLAKLLPLMAQLLHDYCDFDEGTDILSDGELSDVDHLIFTLLSSFGKICKACDVIQNELYKDDMTQMWNSVERYLEHPHLWVQLAASRLFGQLFACWKPSEVAAASGKEESNGYLQQAVTEKLSHLISAFIKQFESSHVTVEQGEQLVKNLIFLAEMANLMEGGVEISGKYETVLSVGWMINQISKVGRREAGYTPQETIKRSCVFKWLGALALKLHVNKLSQHLACILKPVVQELEFSDKHSLQDKNSDLKMLAQEVSDLIRGVVGQEAFSRGCADVLKELTATRESRKRERALEAVTNPEKRAKKKVKKNLAKKESRKRKIKLMKHPAKWKKF